MPFNEKFREQVTKKTAEGKSYQQIAEDLGLKGRSSIPYYMNKRGTPKTDLLKKMSKYFNVPISYFLDDEPSTVLNQQKVVYETNRSETPVMSDESTKAITIEKMVVPALGTTDNFAITVDDDRLENIGVPRGSTVFFTKKFKLSDKHQVIVQQGKNRFFATYEKCGKDAVITPVDPKMSRIVLDKTEKSNTKIYAVATHKLTSI